MLASGVNLLMFYTHQNGGQILIVLRAQLYYASTIKPLDEHNKTLGLNTICLIVLKADFERPFYTNYNQEQGY